MYILEDCWLLQGKGHLNVWNLNLCQWSINSLFIISQATETDGKKILKMKLWFCIVICLWNNKQRLFQNNSLFRKLQGVGASSTFKCASLIDSWGPQSRLQSMAHRSTRPPAQVKNPHQPFKQRQKIRTNMGCTPSQSLLQFRLPLWQSSQSLLHRDITKGVRLDVHPLPWGFQEAPRLRLIMSPFGSRGLKSHQRRTIFMGIPKIMSGHPGSSDQPDKWQLGSFLLPGASCK